MKRIIVYSYETDEWEIKNHHATTEVNWLRCRQVEMNLAEFDVHV